MWLHVRHVTRKCEKSSLFVKRLFRFAWNTASCKRKNLCFSELPFAFALGPISKWMEMHLLCVWLKRPTSASLVNLLSRPTSACGTLFGFMPELQSAPSPDIYTLFCLSCCLETGGKIQDGCTFFTVSAHFSVAESHRSCATPNCIKDTQEATHFHLFVFCRREQLLECKHTAGRWMLHALAEWCVCVLEQESLICATMNM